MTAPMNRREAVRATAAVLGGVLLTSTDSSSRAPASARWRPARAYCPPTISR